MLTRRSLLFSPFIPLIFNMPSISAPVAPVVLPNLRITDSAADIIFEMDINDNSQLLGTFAAPTTGWLAVGLNITASLAGTRFLIAARDHTNTLNTQEHIAQPPDHHAIERFNAAPMFTVQKLENTGNGSLVTFTAKRSVPPPYPCNFKPGSEAGLMLAWSQEPDFNHHSAWRRHFTIKI